MNGKLLGRWSLTSQGIHEFKYEQSWLESPYRRPLSLSMPLQPSTEVYKGGVVENYFENLLPNNIDIRRLMQNRFGTRSTRAFELLKEVGRDCVGAVQIVPGEEEPPSVHTISAKSLSPEDISKLLKSILLPSSPGGEDAGFRISLAGAQEKTALLLNEGSWCLPLGSTPTTHIFKLPLGVVARVQIDLSTSVENEWLCMNILSAYGIECAETRIADFDGQKTLIVTRFDRRLAEDSTWWIRVPQEDMCQVLGISPDTKYEAEGGPGIIDIMQVLLASGNALSDRLNFIKIQILFWMLAAIDGHGKNFSLFIGPFGRFHLTPIYDVLSAYPVMGHGAKKLSPEKIRMAMAVYGKNRHYKWNNIFPRHWIHTGELAGLNALVIKDILADIKEKTPQVIYTVSSHLPKDFPPELAELIFRGLENAAKMLAY